MVLLEGIPPREKFLSYAPAGFPFWQRKKALAFDVEVAVEGNDVAQDAPKESKGVKGTCFGFYAYLHLMITPKFHD